MDGQVSESEFQFRVALRRGVVRRAARGLELAEQPLDSRSIHCASSDSRRVLQKSRPERASAAQGNTMEGVVHQVMFS